MSLLVLHHDDLVGLDRLADSLEARALELVHVDATTGDLPAAGAHAGILVLGGRQSVADPDELPSWLDAELDLLRAANDEQVPVLGLCLGAQTVALAHGGRVERRETPELGMLAIHRTVPGAQDPVTAGWPDGAPALASHFDEVTRLPDAAVQLLVGTDGPTMWRIGSSHATQLHPEASVDTLRSWLDARDFDMAEQAGLDRDDVLARASALDSQASAAGTSLVLRWVDHLDW